MPLSDEDAAALIAEVERAKRELERAKRELKRAKREKELQKREFEVELEWLQYEAELVSSAGKCEDADVPPVGGTAAVSADGYGTCCRSTCDRSDDRHPCLPRYCCPWCVGGEGGYKAHVSSWAL